MYPWWGLIWNMLPQFGTLTCKRMLTCLKGFNSLHVNYWTNCNYQHLPTSGCIWGSPKWMKLFMGYCIFYQMSSVLELLCHTIFAHTYSTNLYTLSWRISGQLVVNWLDPAGEGPMRVLHTLDARQVQLQHCGWCGMLIVFTIQYSNFCLAFLHSIHCSPLLVSC